MSDNIITFPDKQGKQATPQPKTAAAWQPRSLGDQLLCCIISRSVGLDQLTTRDIFFVTCVCENLSHYGLVKPDPTSRFKYRPSPVLIKIIASRAVPLNAETFDTTIGERNLSKKIKGLYSEETFLLLATFGLACSNETKAAWFSTRELDRLLGRKHRSAR
jgi:hypothetical protein